MILIPPSSKACRKGAVGPMPVFDGKKCHSTAVTPLPGVFKSSMSFWICLRMLFVSEVRPTFASIAAPAAKLSITLFPNEVLRVTC